MEASLSKTSVSCLKQVYRACFSREESTEAVVPDVLPDIGEITCAEGMVLLRSKELHQGHLTLTGTVVATVLYLPEGECCPRKLSMELPYSITAESAAVTEQCRAAATVRLCYLEARALNPRKVALRAELGVEAACYAPETIELCTGVEAACPLRVQTKLESVCASPVLGVWEKTFVLTDEYALPAGRSAAAELVGHSVELTPEDAKLVGTKLIFKGTAKLSLSWYGEDGTLCASVFPASFSQILEVGEVSEHADMHLRLMLTGAYFELLPTGQSARTVSAEVHVLAQAVCEDSMELHYMADAYSNEFPLELQHPEPQLLCRETPLSLRDSMRGLVELPFPVREVVRVWAELGTWTVEQNRVRCPVNVKLLLRDEEDAFRGLVRGFVSELEAEIEDGAALEVRAVSCTELYATPAAGGVEVRLLVEAAAAARTAVHFQPVCAITADEESPLETASLPSVVVLPRRDGDLWEIAKRYRSTPELIRAANEELAGSVLLVPRAR